MTEDHDEVRLLSDVVFDELLSGAHDFPVRIRVGNMDEVLVGWLKRDEIDGCAGVGLARFLRDAADELEEAK